jgi:hypothetical protein
MTVKLIYGFEIGAKGNWKVQEAPADESGQRNLISLPWYNDGQHYPNFQPMAWDRLFEAMPNPPIGTPGPQRENMARSYYGVTFEDIGTPGDPSAVLAVTDLRYETSESAPLAINPGALQSRPISGRYSEKLRRALLVLGLTPVQLYPQWLLAELHTDQI